jgi:uncharacterized repeat protein (TIGR03803 family)
MHREQFPTPLFRVISLAVIAALSITAAAIPSLAQNSVPPTAVQAAKMPQYASRLAHPSKRLLPETSAMQRAKARRGPLDSDDIYDNGPINGNVDAWTMNFGFITSDSFNIASNQSQITGMNFGAWLFPGDTVSSVEVSITALENGGTSYFDQTVNFTQGSCTVNQLGFNVCTETGSFNGPTLNAGTYWVNLQNASVPSGDPVYWDENSGVGCQGQGCPSSASENTVGSIPSESFTILGNGTTTTSTSTFSNYCPAPQSGFREIHDFGLLHEYDTPSDVVVNQTGSLYGTLATAGQYGAGLLYGLGQRAGHWFYSTLYSFLGGSNPGNPYGVIAGPQGALYGSAAGGPNGYGLIYKATPPPNACATALCSWDVTTIYEFTASDGFGVTAFDSAGNLYGISEGGGAYGAGAVYELSPSQGGWTEKLLYSFTGGSDGGNPNRLLVGLDGNLYGTTWSGGIEGYCINNPWGQYEWCGVAFQLVPSAGGWTENVLYTFTGNADDGWGPNGLIQDSQGNLYGVTTCHESPSGGCWDDYSYPEVSGIIFVLSKSGGEWGFNKYHVYYAGECVDEQWNVTYHALATDAGGNLYASAGGVEEGVGQEYYCGIVEKVSNCCFSTLVSGATDMFYNLTSDAIGNLYGTTNTCGFGNPQRTTGMVWQYSP